MRTFVVASLASALLAPLLSAQQLFQRNMGTNLGLADDATVTGLSLAFSFPYAGSNYTSISVCANGYILLGSNSIPGGDPVPSTTALQTGPARIAPLWADYDPSTAGSGNVWFDSLPNQAVISWAGVYEKGAASPVNFQLVLYPNGHLSVAYGKNWLPATTKLDRLIGASTGNGATFAAVDFAAHPLLTVSDLFAQTFRSEQALPYVAMMFDWSPAFPGFAISHVPTDTNALPPPARFDEVGLGCVYRGVSIYQICNGANDPSGMELVFTPNGQGGYIVSKNVLRPAQLAQVQLIAAGGDTRHVVMLPFAWPHATGLVDRVTIGANGFITLGSEDPGPGDYSLDAAQLLQGPPRIAGFWTNLDPSLGGTLSTVYDPVFATFSVRWDAVPEWPNVGRNTFAITLSPDGSFRIQLTEVLLQAGLCKAIVGYSDGRNAANPGAFDFVSMTAPVNLGQHIDRLELAAWAGSQPRIGSVFTMHVSKMRGMLCYLLIGAQTPPIDLGIIGAPDCMQYVALPSQITLLNAVFGMPTTDFVVSIPNSIDLAGMLLMSQAVSDDAAANALGWRTSNGGRWTIGL